MRFLMILLLAFFVSVPSGGFSQGTLATYAVGDGPSLVKLVDGSWVPVDLGGITGCTALRDIWGSSPDDIYVTGCGEELLHFNGDEWQKITIPADDPLSWGPLAAVGGTAHDNVFVGGTVDWGFSVEGVAYHYDGSEWTSIHGETGSIDGIRRIWADPGGGLYATGYYYDHLTFQSYDRVMRFYDGTWSTELREEVDYDQNFIGIDGLAPGVPFVVGDWYNPMAGYGGGIWAKFSSSWTSITQSEEVGCFMYSSYCPIWPVNWFGVCCVFFDDIWVVGESGRVLHWSPAGYTEYDTGVTETLNAIWKNSLGLVYAAGDNGKIVYFDGGTWTEMASSTTGKLTDIWGISEVPVAALLQAFSAGIDPSGITLRWTLSKVDEGVDFRILRSREVSTAFVIDDGSNIERNGLSFKYLDSDVQPGSGYAYIVEYSDDGEWKMLLESERITVPGASFGLMTNFPNPFNPSTKITYAIPGHGHVSLKIYDVSGKLVRTLVSGLQGPGEHFAYWNGMNDQGIAAASGTYFCRLISEKQAATRKMLLMR
ncbi:MAG: T9SS type A sorting domain-containing protein [Candidatus Krumholzibacteriota bacterium]|nr:T9SS type A sorting domain-containing protein [Candidatus Krumholzibacteriota bacterium]